MEFIPVVDLSKITGDNETADETCLIDIAKEVFHALSGIGFVYLKNHGIGNDILQKAFFESRRFFELPQELKEKCRKDINKCFNNGYDAAHANLENPNLRFQGQRSGLSSELTYEIRETYDICGNTRYYPECCPNLGPSLTALEEACRTLTKTLLRILAISLNLDDHDYFVTRSKYLDDHNVKSTTTLRTLYYPPIPDNVPVGTVRCADHTDYGILTLLFQDHIGGLQVRSVSGKWISAKPVPGTVLVNTGDLLQFWSGGKFPATHHKVLIPEEEVKQKTSRQSIVLFVHPDDNVIVSPLTGNSLEYAAVTGNVHATQKLASTFK